MKPAGLKTKIFLDSGDPEQTETVLGELGFLDGQTTNPSLITKHPDAQKRLQEGKKFSRQELLSFYREVVEGISLLIPQGSVSVEVYADSNTTAQEMISQATDLFNWVNNVHIKLPINQAGLQAANYLVKEGVRVNMTLCFTQVQAAAVALATQGAKPGQVFVSPFVGRLDDKGENGMDLVVNIIKMYKEVKSPVSVLTASVRSLDHFLAAISLNSDIITAPKKILDQWVEQGTSLPDNSFKYQLEGLTAIEYQNLDFSKPWTEFDLDHPLTAQGIERFAADWNSLIE